MRTSYFTDSHNFWPAGTQPECGACRMERSRWAGVSCSRCPGHAHLAFWGLSTCDSAFVCPSLEDITLAQFERGVALGQFCPVGSSGITLEWVPGEGEVVWRPGWPQPEHRANSQGGRCWSLLRWSPALPWPPALLEAVPGCPPLNLAPGGVDNVGVHRVFNRMGAGGMSWGRG